MEVAIIHVIRCYCSWFFHGFMGSRGQTRYEFVVQDGLYLEFMLKEFMVIPWVHWLVGGQKDVDHVLDGSGTEVHPAVKSNCD